MSSQVEILQQHLELNPNPRGLKLVIVDRMRDIENLAYWKCSCSQDELLMNFWQHSVHSDHVLKRKIEAVVGNRTTEVQLQIVSGVKEMGKTQYRQQEIEVLEESPETNTTRQMSKSHKKNKSLQLDPQLTAQSALLDELVLQDYPLNNHEYFSINSKRTQQTQQYIRQLKKDYRQFKEQMQSRREKILERKQELAEEQLHHEQLLKEEQKKKYHSEMQQHLDKLKHQNQRREEQRRQFQRFYREYKQQKPLHVMIEEQYKQRVELPMLEEQLSKEQNRPHRVKPSLEELNAHDNRYMEMKHDREQNPSVTISHEKVNVMFRGKFYRKAARSYNHSLDCDDSQEDAYQRMQKIQKYAEYVKDELKPKVDQYKRRQLEQRIKSSSLAYPLSAIKNAEKEEDMAAKAQQINDRKYTLEVGNRYMELVHRKAKKRENSVDNSDHEGSEAKQSHKVLPKKINYLEEQKQLHLNKRTNLENWQKDFNDPNLTDYDRRQRVLLKSRLLEETAMRHEKKLLNDDSQSHTDRINTKRQIDDALLEAIRAKMAVLKN